MFLSISKTSYATARFRKIKVIRLYGAIFLLKLSSLNLNFEFEICEFNAMKCALLLPLIRSYLLTLYKRFFYIFKFVSLYRSLQN